MKTIRILIVLLIIFVGIPLLGRMFWVLKRSKPIDILIVNKTVPAVSRNEVKALNWVLNYQKYVKTSRTHYDYELDYFGFFPNAPESDRLIKSYKIEDFPELVSKYNALFFIDNSGQALKTKNYTGKFDWYGGFNQNDYLLLKEMMANHKLILAEYNFISDPTPDLVRYNTEQLIDIYHVGWEGKYFSNLSKEKMLKEIPGHWIDNYAELNGKVWDYTGKGIVLINKSLGRIIVLPSGKYSTGSYPTVVTDKQNSKKYKLPAKAAYAGWFNVVYPGNNHVISNLDLNLNTEGISLLKDNGLESIFPIVIVSPDTHFYYVAGDFSKTPVYYDFSRLSFVSVLFKGVLSQFKNNPNMFFQTYYTNLLSSVIGNYYKEENIKGIK